MDESDVTEIREDVDQDIDEFDVVTEIREDVDQPDRPIDESDVIEIRGDVDQADAEAGLYYKTHQNLTCGPSIETLVIRLLVAGLDLAV